MVRDDAGAVGSHSRRKAHPIQVQLHLLPRRRSAVVTPHDILPDIPLQDSGGRAVLRVSKVTLSVIHGAPESAVRVDREFIAARGVASSLRKDLETLGALRGADPDGDRELLR